MTRQEAKLLAFVAEYTATEGIPPSYAECCTALEIKSKAGVLRLATSLVDQGRLRRAPYKARSLEAVPQTAEPITPLLIDEIVGAVLADHAVRETDSPQSPLLIICTEEELRATLRSLVAK